MNLGLLKSFEDNEKLMKMVYSLIIRVVEFGIIFAFLYGGIDMKFKRVCSDVETLMVTVGTSSGKDGNLCERQTKTETNFEFIKDQLKAINVKIDNLPKGGS